MKNKQLGIGMSWINANKRLPEPLVNKYIRIRDKHPSIMGVGFFIQERGLDGRFPGWYWTSGLPIVPDEKHIEWLDEQQEESK